MPTSHVLRLWCQLEHFATFAGKQDVVFAYELFALLLLFCDGMYSMRRGNGGTNNWWLLMQGT